VTTFYTIGHSNRSIAAFLSLLQEAGTGLAADVRTVPKSRHNPQFNTHALAASLGAAGIGYRHMPALGGLRPPRKEGGQSQNGFWENEAFRNFADYAATEEFRQGLEELRELGRLQSCAIMCA
jgi:uncharacterized protein (DUF488 family)